ncbi:MAG TPA: hypothetical protein VFJ77_11945 [Gaiellaceae bacterium]|nr:hypothetical protein [Gaiellaceae bacterium]
MRYLSALVAAAAVSLGSVHDAQSRVELLGHQPWLFTLPALQHGGAEHATAHRRAARPAGPGHAKVAKRAARPHAHAKRAHAKRAHAKHAVAKHAAPRATISLYERTTNRRVLRRQGCSAAKRGVGGIVILDFGKPASRGHRYGTILFSNRFASNREITLAMLAYAGGYRYCLRRGSHETIVLARGTSNYRPSVPSTFRAGRMWARETMQLARWLKRFGMREHVSSAAAIDAEPAWDPSFHRTRDFFRGYRASKIGRPLYNFGSLDGGVGSYWNARQIFYVTAGMRYARPIPEIYNRTMAKQWAHAAWLAKRKFHTKLRFAGVMTQHVEGCRTCGFLPPVAHKTLVRELAARNVHAEVPAVTNIRSAR